MNSKGIIYSQPKMVVVEIKMTSIVCESPTEPVTPGGGHDMDLNSFMELL